MMNPVDGLLNVSSRVGRWVRENVTGTDGENSDYTPVNNDAKEIKDQFEKIGDKIGKVDNDISKIADLSGIKPPKLSDISDKDLVILGAAGGAAVGGGIGVANSLISIALDNPQIEVTKVDHDIQKPVLKGFQHQTSDRTDSSGNLSGTMHSFTPQIEYEKVGTYTVPEADASHSVKTSSPVASGLKHMAAGGVIGGAVGMGVAVGRKILKKGMYEPHEKREIEGEAKVIAASAGLGALGGAAACGLGALMEAGKADAKDLSWKQPVMEKQTIGQIAKDTMVSIFDVYREDNLPKRDVTVDSPKMEKGLLGGEKVVMEKIESTVKVEPRFGILGQIAGGAVLGAIGGTLAGVVVNVLRKIL